MAIKNTSPQSSDLKIRLTQEIISPLKTLSLSSQKLLDKYKSKNFEYISYKDFRSLLFTIEQMNKQINRCYQKMQGLLGVTRSKVKDDSCDINAVILDFLKFAKSNLFNSKIKTNIRLASKLPQVKVNRVDGYQIVKNILINAIHAMPAGGGLRVKTSYDQKTNLVLIDISDDGVGISQQRLAKIFEPFYTTKEQGVEKSSGLGLSIVYSIVQAAGGVINIKSSLRKGTQVEIFLPAVIS